MVIAIHTYHKPSGFRTVARGIEEALREAGLPVELYDGDITSCGVLAKSGVIDTRDLYVPVWHVSRHLLMWLVDARPRIAYYAFVEGEPLIDPEIIEPIKDRITFLCPSSYVASKIAKRFKRCIIAPPTLPSNVYYYDGLLYRSLRRICERYDACLSYVATNVPRKGWTMLEPVTKVLERDYGMRVCWLVATNADLPNKLGNRSRVVKLELGEGLSDAVISSIILASDMYVNLSFNEGFGVPIAIAFLLGKPVVAVDAPGIRACFHELPVCFVKRKRVETINWLNEVLQELYVYDPEEMAAAIVTVKDFYIDFSEETTRNLAYFIFMQRNREALVKVIRSLYEETIKK